MRTHVGKRRQNVEKRKIMRRGKWLFFGPFWRPWMTISCFFLYYIHFFLSSCPALPSPTHTCTHNTQHTTHHTTQITSHHIWHLFGAHFGGYVVHRCASHNVVFFLAIHRVVNVVIASNAMIGEWRSCFESAPGANVSWWSQCMDGRSGCV